MSEASMVSYVDMSRNPRFLEIRDGDGQRDSFSGRTVENPDGELLASLRVCEVLFCFGICCDDRS